MTFLLHLFQPYVDCMSISYVGPIDILNLNLHIVTVSQTFSLASICQLCDLNLIVPFFQNGCQIHDPWTGHTTGISRNVEKVFELILVPTSSFISRSSFF